jgi:hypothetical protein
VTPSYCRRPSSLNDVIRGSSPLLHLLPDCWKQNFRVWNKTRVAVVSGNRETLDFAAQKYKSKATRALQGAPNSHQPLSWPPSPHLSWPFLPPSECSPPLASFLPPTLASPNDKQSPLPKLVPMAATTTPFGLMVAALLTTPMALVVHTALPGRMMVTLLLGRDGTLVAPSKMSSKWQSLSILS